jgi:hypothetical protein
VSRVRGAGCPCCSGHKATRPTCLATTHPEVAKEWHSTKNGDLTPADVTAGSGKKVWWQCSKTADHEWEGIIQNRAKGCGCPYCSNRRLNESNCLTAAYPAMAKEWHPTKNGDLTSDGVPPKSGKRVWWQCDKGHEWKATVSHRINGTGCPICSNRTADLSNCLASTHPALLTNGTYARFADPDGNEEGVAGRTGSRCSWPPRWIRPRVAPRRCLGKPLLIRPGPYTARGAAG